VQRITSPARQLLNIATTSAQLAAAAATATATLRPKQTLKASTPTAKAAIALQAKHNPHQQQ
jgi:hypothetical protein